MAEKAPLVSVLMPVYNGEDYLLESIDSILSQTYKNFEFIIIDDCSSDGTEKILSELEDSRLRICRNDKNMGVALSLNRGISMAQGKFVARQDSDDISMVDRLRLQVNYLLKRPNCVAVGGQLKEINPAGEPIGWRFVPLAHKDIVDRMLQGRGGQIPHPSAMISMDAYKKIGAYREEFEMAEDLDLFLRLSEVGKISNLPNILVDYRIHSESVSESKKQQQFEVAKRVSKEALMRRGMESHSEVSRVSKVKFDIFKKIMKLYLKHTTV